MEINKGWYGNPNLKPFGFSIQYTKEQLEEYLKCKTDIIYFVKNYCKIVSLDHGLVDFKLYPYQEKLIRAYHENRWVITLQPRQFGKSISTAAYLLHYTIFNDDKTVAILANKAATAREILSRFQLMYENLPLFLQQGVKEWNKGSIELENGSKVFTSATSSSGIRGKSCVTGDTKVCVKYDNEISVISINDYLMEKNFKQMKILSGNNKFEDFDGFIDQGIPEQLLKISFNNTDSIKATPDHLFLVGSEWVECQYLCIGDNLSGSLVTFIEYVEPERVYDAYNVNESHSYYTNGVISHNCNIIYLDEFAIIPNTIADDFITSTYPTISSGETTKIIISSTAYGLNHFWHFWNEAENKINGFVPIRVRWQEHPEKDDAWAAKQLQLLKEVKFNQEVECKFLGSSSTLINAQTLQNLTPHTPVSSNEDRSLVLYEEPFLGTQTKSAASYVIVVDTASGVGGDSSTFSVFRIDELPYKIVARYKSNTISPMLYPNIIDRWGKEYNEAWVLIEINKNEQIPHILFNELEYENLVYVSRSKNGQEVSGGFGGGRTQLGVMTDKKVKRIGCSMLKSLIEEQKLVVTDAETISEISTFIEKRGSYAADDGKNDDLVMTLVLFGWLVSQPYFKELTSVDLRQSIINERLKQIDEEMLPTGFFSDGTEVDESIEQWEDYPVR